MKELRRRADEYVTPADARAASPLFADLSGLAPMLVQAGSHDILLAMPWVWLDAWPKCDGPVKLDVWPDGRHSFKLRDMLDEGVEALDALGAFVDSWLSAVDSARTA